LTVIERGDVAQGPFDEDVDFAMHVAEVALDFAGAVLATLESVYDITDEWRSFELRFEVIMEVGAGSKLTARVQRRDRR